MRWIRGWLSTRLTVENSIRLFADDTKLYRAVSSADDGRKSLQREINRLDACTSQKLILKVHPDKCKIMRTGQRHREHTYTMKTSDDQTTELNKTTAEKDLGVTMDNQLIDLQRAHQQHCEESHPSDGDDKTNVQIN